MTENSAIPMLKAMDALNNQIVRKCAFQALLEKAVAFYVFSLPNY